MAAPAEGGMVIDGQTVAALDGETFDVFSPWTGELVGTAPRAGPADVEAAVAAAARPRECVAAVAP